jgi:hypothetical protein
MALKLLIEPGQGYHVTDAQARRWVEDRSERQRQAVRDGQPVAKVAPRLRELPALEDLANGQRIRKVQLDAGREIRTYWRLWTTAFSAAIANYDGERRQGGPGPDPVSVRGLVDRYRGWAASAEAGKVKGDLTALTLVLDLCVRDWAPWQMRCEYRISDTRALRICQDSLLEYGRLAGWRIDEREAA